MPLKRILGGIGVPRCVHSHVVVVGVLFVVAHAIARTIGISVKAALCEPLGVLVLQLHLPQNLNFVAHILGRQIDRWLVL